MPLQDQSLYVGDLLPDNVKGDHDRIAEMKDRALKKAAPIAMQELKREIDRHSFKRPPTRLKESFSYEIRESRLIIESDHPAATYLEEGVEPHQMDYLQDADGPIPIMTDDGEVIFREATEESMEDGSWFHPGLQGKHFLERALDKAKERVLDEMKREYADFLRQEVEDRMGDHGARIRRRLEET